MLSIEKNNSIFDKMTMLFVLTSCHILLLNVSGNMTSEFENILTVAVNALIEIRKIGNLPKPKVHLILNKNGNLDKEHHM